MTLEATAPHGDEATMSIVEHIEEVRRRIIVIALTVLIASVGAFFLADPLIALLRLPLPRDGAELIQTRIGEAFGVRIQLALMAGVAIAMPVILYEVWAFITPALSRGERRLVWPLLAVAVILFGGGITLGYLLIPVAVNFLLDFSLEGVRPLLGLADYVSFVTTLLFAFGLALQFPVVLYVLARMGILSYAFLARRRRWAVVLIILFAVAITPGDIVVGSGALALVMYGLFELTLQVIRMLHR